MARVSFTDQHRANRFASEIRRLYGADRWQDLEVEPRAASVEVPDDLPNLSELAHRFEGRLERDTGAGPAQGEGATSSA